MESHSETASSFTETSTRVLLDEACRAIGVDGSDAKLLRLGENAIYALLSLKIVARVARTQEQWGDAAKEVAVSGLFSRSGIRAVHATVMDRPIDVDGHPVTFWEYIEGRNGESGDIRELGVMLRNVHQLGGPTELRLPSDDPLGRVERRIDRARVPASDREVLSAKLDMLARELPELSYPLPPSVVHGDAHVENLMVDADGPILIDLERVAWGHPEWDLAVTATEYVSAGFWTAEQYAEFVDSYGYDVMEWDGFDLLRQTHELKMTSWLMQNVDESDEIREEYELRMEAIRGGRSSRPWTPF